MKLTVARCPSCGAQIEVDKDSDSTRCEYCNSKIVVEEAIEKYNNGKVEVSNLPKFDNFIVLADRNYKDAKYDEAAKYYGKALELDPYNVHAIMKQGFSKSLCTQFNNLDVDSPIKALKNVEDKIQEDKDEFRNIISECNNIITIAYSKLNDYYKLNGLEKSEAEFFNNKLRDCFKGFEYLYSFAEDDELKTVLLTNILNALDSITNSKVYRTGRIMQSGVPEKNFYRISNAESVLYRDAKVKYRKELNDIKAKNNPNFGKTKTNSISGLNLNIDEKTRKVIGYCFSGNFIIAALIFAIIGLKNGLIALSPVIALPSILFLPPFSDFIGKKIDKKFGSGREIMVAFKIVAIMFTGILMLLALSSVYSEKVYEGKWKAENGMTIELKNDKAIITDVDGNSKEGTYYAEQDGITYIIRVNINKNSEDDGEKEKIIIKCEVVNETVKFYIENKESERTYFKPENPKSSYEYLTE